MNSALKCQFCFSILKSQAYILECRTIQLIQHLGRHITVEQSPTHYGGAEYQHNLGILTGILIGIFVGTSILFVVIVRADIFHQIKKYVNDRSTTVLKNDPSVISNFLLKNKKYPIVKSAKWDSMAIDDAGCI